MFPSEVAMIINVKATNDFVEYEWTMNNHTTTVLAETFLLINH